ncbi:WD repeat-containing protein 89 homolog isoform X1 [Chenopodium quinoa]|uniref:WD repeat-containing protein 89 homolog isoform X1 n=1 Tax=Chenopodium quinoa TaxID=63459 RepID=UPI000B79494F|nr:WD repeat-containing protein 89 homolog isoform X1 [Chenopodium quinoa]
MAATEMEVEEQQQQPNSNSTSFKRFGLKNSIQTNFGDDYVFQITSREDWSAMAVSLSNNLVKLYSPTTGQYIGECRGHTSTINEIAFADSSSPHLLLSCSSDATIRAWDTRNLQQVSLINAGPSQEVFSFSYGGVNNLLAGGCKSQILIWDWRNKKQVACLEESHVEDVTQVRFVPGTQNKLISASVDGLMCLFDTAGDINDDDHLYSVMNVGTSIGKIGFFGQDHEKLWCLTHIETLSVWDWKEEKVVADFQEARSLASESWVQDHVDYFIDCHCSSEDDRLWVIGGTNSGTIAYFPVNYNGRVMSSPEAILEGGHAGIVRSILPASGLPRQSSNNGMFGWTGGEDGRLCCWMSDATSDLNRAWISSSLAVKPSKTRKKTRHQPY